LPSAATGDALYAAADFRQALAIEFIAGFQGVRVEHAIVRDT
jgi:hypothetical protein